MIRKHITEPFAPGRGARLRRYLDAPELTAGEAARTLRAAFAWAFGAQALVAAAVGLGATTVTDTGQAHAAVGGALVLVAAGQGVVLLLVQGSGARSVARAASEWRRGERDGPRGVRTAALAVAVFAAVLAATPLWFLAFGVVVGLRGLPLVAVAALAAAYYGLEIPLLGRLARSATPPRAPVAEAEA